jgi:hypothetical protein
MSQNAKSGGKWTLGETRHFTGQKIFKCQYIAARGPIITDLTFQNSENGLRVF